MMVFHISAKKGHGVSPWPLFPVYPPYANLLSIMQNRFRNIFFSPTGALSAVQMYVYTLIFGHCFSLYRNWFVAMDKKNSGKPESKYSGYYTLNACPLKSLGLIGLLVMLQHFGFHIENNLFCNIFRLVAYALQLTNDGQNI